MGDLVATDVVISVPVDKRDIGHGALQKNVTIADLTFGNGVSDRWRSLTGQGEIRLSQGDRCGSDRASLGKRVRS